MGCMGSRREWWLGLRESCCGDESQGWDAHVFMRSVYVGLDGFDCMALAFLDGLERSREVCMNDAGLRELLSWLVYFKRILLYTQRWVSLAALFFFFVLGCSDLDIVMNPRFRSLTVLKISTRSAFETFNSFTTRLDMPMSLLLTQNMK